MILSGALELYTLTVEVTSRRYPKMKAIGPHHLQFWISLVPNKA